MEITVTAKPHMLLETLELLYACINHHTPEDLTCPGAYCLPVESIQEMMDMVYLHCDCNDPTLRHYFTQHQFFTDPEQTTCLARHLLYKNSAVSHGPIQADFDALRQLWEHQTARHWHLTGINKYHLSFGLSQDTQNEPLTRGTTRLGVKSAYGKILLEQLDNWSNALDLLEGIISPLAQKLQPLFLPWAEQAEALAQVWREYYAQPDGEDKLCRRLQFKDTDSLSALEIQLRYLRPKEGPGNSWVQQGDHRIFLHIGVAVPVEHRAKTGFDAGDFHALRLLGSESRMQMLRVMLDKPMSSRELAKAMNLHLGVVTRDISSLHQVGLLTLEITDRHRRYRTNMQTLQDLIRRLSELKQYTFPLLDHL